MWFDILKAGLYSKELNQKRVQKDHSLIDKSGGKLCEICLFYCSVSSPVYFAMIFSYKFSRTILFFI